MITSKNLTLIAVFLLLQLSCSSDVDAQDTGFAKDLYVHNLKSRSLELFVEIFHNPKSPANNKAEALYHMGQISFDDGRYSTALDDWQRLIKDYPTNSKAIEIKGRLSQLKEVFAKVTDASITSTIAQSYVNNGDFWSDADKKFTIDGSWLPRVELALQWYEKVIAEYPGSDGAEIAFQRKLFTLLGWKEIGQYAQSYGVQSNYSTYMPTLLKTFEEFEAAFPNSSYLQGFRYQIAQAYWGHKDWDDTRKWLNKIIEMGKGQQSFYTETAKARLQKVEF
jgi:tetratricopeptide (TPR) repeat protein